MPTYEVTPEIAGWSPKRMALRFSFVAAGLFAVSALLFPSFTSRNDWELAIIGALFGGFSETFFGLNYKVVVSDDSIKVVHWLYTLSVERNSVRSVVETSGSYLVQSGLRISKHGRLGTFLLGYVWIPRSLPQYESIRGLALTWKTTQ